MKKLLFLALVLGGASFNAFADHPESEAHGEEHATEAHADGDAEESTFNAGEMIMHHIADAHDSLFNDR